jgi:hypothetical protein
MSQDGYEMSWFRPTAISLVNEKIIPTKMNENKTKEINTIDFLAATCTDITSL